MSEDQEPGTKDWAELDREAVQIRMWALEIAVDHLNGQPGAAAFMS